MDNITFNKLDNIYEKSNLGDMGGINVRVMEVNSVNINPTVMLTEEVATGATGDSDDKNILTYNDIDMLEVVEDEDGRSDNKGDGSRGNELELRAVDIYDGTALDAREVNIMITTAFNPLSGVPLVELEQCEPTSKDESNQNLTYIAVAIEKSQY